MTTSDARRRSLEWGLCALFLLGFYYNSYRYPFQINDYGSSPTYSDTPVWLSVGKYVIASVMLVYLGLNRLRWGGRVKLARPLHLCAYALLALLPITSGLVFQRWDFVSTGFFFLVPMILQMFSGWSMSFARLNRLLATTVWIALAVEAFQVLMFLTVGRLPALGYADSFAVRFGTFLDDPNGFGLMLSWLIPFSALYFRGGRRVVAVSLLFVSLLLTQSLTALAAFAGVSVLLTCLYIASNPRAVVPVLAFTMCASVALVIPVLIYWNQLVYAYQLYMLMKLGSIVKHAEALLILEEVELLNFLGLEPLLHRWVETAYVNLLIYFGVVYLAVYLLVGVSGLLWYLRSYWNRSASWDERCFSFAALGLLLAVYAGNFNLPVISIFPLDLLAAMHLGIASARLRDEAEPVREVPPRRSLPSRELVRSTAA